MDTIYTPNISILAPFISSLSVPCVFGLNTANTPTLKKGKLKKKILRHSGNGHNVHTQHQHTGSFHLFTLSTLWFLVWTQRTLQHLIRAIFKKKYFLRHSVYGLNLHIQRWLTGFFHPFTCSTLCLLVWTQRTRKHLIRSNFKIFYLL